MQEKLRLAGHLKKTLKEIDEMDGDEFAIWQAWSRYHVPFDNSWEPASILACVISAPHMPHGFQFSPKDFMPIAKAPQHQSQIDKTLEAIQKDLGYQ